MARVVQSLFVFPFAVFVGDVQAAGAVAEAGADEEVGVADSGGLDAASAAVEQPLVFPEDGAVLRLKRGQAVARGQQRLLDAVDLGELQGAVAELAFAGRPRRICRWRRHSRRRSCPARRRRPSRLPGRSTATPRNPTAASLASELARCPAPRVRFPSAASRQRSLPAAPIV